MISLPILAEAARGRIVGDPRQPVSGLQHDSRAVRPGDLFVALPGESSDGAEFVAEAVAHGAVAACVADDAASRLDNAGVPLLLVANPRAALALMSAAFHGDPARELRLIGVTGTLGKTSTALLVQAALAADAAGAGVGVVGSLGASVCSWTAGSERCESVLDLDGMTTPDPPALHRALRAMVDAGVRTAAMEVTSHALAHDRVDGLVFELGVITNLVPDEHLEFHATPEDYLRTKARFLEHLTSSTPLVFNADDPLVREMVAASLICAPRPLVGVTLGEFSRALDKDPDDFAARDAAVSVEGLRWSARGSSFTLRLRRPLPLLDGGELHEREIPVTLPVLGAHQVANAALAATTALVAGASDAAVTRALAQIAPVRRRMEVIREAAPCVLDDTTGNPETLRAVFFSIEAIPRETLRVVFGLRGARGIEINRRLAETLAELVRDRAREEPVQLVVTWCDDTADERNRVTPEEREAALGVLEAANLGTNTRYSTEPTLRAAVSAVLDGAAEDDLVLLLGTQGLDEAAGLARELLGG